MQYRFVCACQYPHHGALLLRLEHTWQGGHQERVCPTCRRPPGDQVLAIDATSIPNALYTWCMYRYINVFHMLLLQQYTRPLWAISSARYILTALDMHSHLTGSQQMLIPLQPLESATHHHGTKALGLLKLSISSHSCLILTSVTCPCAHWAAGSGCLLCQRRHLLQIAQAS